MVVHEVDALGGHIRIGHHLAIDDVGEAHSGMPRILHGPCLQRVFRTEGRMTRQHPLRAGQGLGGAFARLFEHVFTDGAVEIDERRGQCHEQQQPRSEHESFTE